MNAITPGFSHSENHSYYIDKFWPSKLNEGGVTVAFRFGASAFHENRRGERLFEGDGERVVKIDAVSVYLAVQAREWSK